VLITPGYWSRERSFEAWAPHGVRAKVGATHLPVSDLMNTFTDAGFAVEHVVEAGTPVPDILAVRCVRVRRAAVLAQCSRRPCRWQAGGRRG
jgi:hypothetical protein